MVIFSVSASLAIRTPSNNHPHGWRVRPTQAPVKPECRSVSGGPASVSGRKALDVRLVAAPQRGRHAFVVQRIFFLGLDDASVELPMAPLPGRSEERRVGKEGR